MALEEGFNVVCEKPITTTLEEAKVLEGLAKKQGKKFAVAYAYFGNVMINHMREMIGRGDIGRILTLQGEYIQGWLLKSLDDQFDNTNVWRTQPEFSGRTNSVGDIGSHI